MKTIKKLTVLKQVFLIILAFCCTSIAMAQDEDIQEKKERKARSSFKVWAGANFNGLNLDTELATTSDLTVGYNLGLSYKRGRFFYYEIGARLNRRPYNFTDAFDLSEKSSFSTSAIDIPLSLGINLTSFADRLVGVRLFVSGIPSFTTSKKMDDIGLEEDDIEDFIFYGQAGIGIDIAFFIVEVGYNYGFSNMIKNVNSNPNQGYVNLGFRF